MAELGVLVALGMFVLVLPPQQFSGYADTGKLSHGIGKKLQQDRVSGIAGGFGVAQPLKKFAVGKGRELVKTKPRTSETLDVLSHDWTGDSRGFADSTKTQTGLVVKFDHHSQSIHANPLSSHLSKLLILLGSLSLDAGSGSRHEVAGFRRNAWQDTPKSFRSNP